jgi:hypothetical protein
MTSTHFARAQRCFALAASTTFPAERDTAIARGIAIAQAADLDLDWFDIPGRDRCASAAGPRAAFRRRLAPDEYTVDEIGRLMREHLERMAHAIVAAEAQAGAQDGETAYDARRRNFGAECAAAKARDMARDARR